MRSLTFLVVLVAFFVAFLANVPHRELEWEDKILPMARSFAGVENNHSSNDFMEAPLTGKVVVVTGATSGIGLSLTKMLSRLGATVVALGRSPEKLLALQREIPTVQTVEIDLVDLHSVSQAVDNITQKFEKIDILVNNAGMHDGFNNLWGTLQTAQGYDQVFGVNYLSHFLLTEKLAPTLMNSSNPMVVQVSSSYHWVVDGSDLMPRGDEPPIASQKGGSHGFVAFRSTRSYANTKLAQILHSRALRRRHALLSHARVVNVCPAWVATDISRNGGGISKMVMSANAYDVNGWGMASLLLALFDTENKSDFYTNTALFDFAAYIMSYQSNWMYQVGIRDVLGAILAFSVLFTQRLLPVAKTTSSSPESYNEALGDALYDWSLSAVKPFL